MTSFQKVDELISQSWRSDTLDALKEVVSLPAKSPEFDKDWEKHGYLLQAIQNAASWGQARFPHATFEILQSSGITPALFFDIPASDKSSSNDTFFFYGHLDKQPEATGWSKGRQPFVPCVENDRLYGRGCADDGYSVYCALTALWALEKNGIAHPRCCGLIETGEESGSPDLEHFARLIAPRCGKVGAIAMLDGSVGDYQRFWTTTGFRGTIAATLKVQVLTHGVHSGTASGIIPDSFTIARQVLERFEEAATGTIRDRNFWTDIPSQRLQQIQDAAKLLGNKYTKVFPWLSGVHCKQATTVDNMLAQTWQPQLSIIGAAGLPSLQDAGNVLRPGTALRLSIRIPPHVDAKKAVTSLRNILCSNPPYGAHIQLEDISYAAGWDAKPEQAWFQKAVNQASQEIWGEHAAYFAEGGSIPILNLFEELFPQAQSIVTGVLGPNSNAHGPDEMLHLPYVSKLTCAVARLITSLP